MKYQIIRGFKDVFSKEADLMQKIINNSLKVAKFFNFKLYFPPILESSDLYFHNIGEESDIVKKELYIFQDKSENKLALRPEFTASVARFFVNNNLNQIIPFPIRIFSYGSLFRYERPQKGRYRQLNQLNFETFAKEFNVAEIKHQFNIVENLLQKIGITGYIIKINHLGKNINVRKNFTKALVDFLIPNEEFLSEDSKRRLKTNPLRILDSKDENDKKLLERMPKIKDFYLDNEIEILNEIQKDRKNKCEIDFNIVRGLDYYTGIVFEVISSNEGYAIAGGGEYSKMIESISDGNIDCSAFGFAFGIERLMNETEEDEIDKKLILFAIKDDSLRAKDKIINLVKDLGYSIEFVYEENIKKIFQIANKMEASFLILKQEDEIKKDIFIVKNLETRQQFEIKDVLSKLSNEIEELLDSLSIDRVGEDLKNIFNIT